jgi:hypothetical protein
MVIVFVILHLILSFLQRKEFFSSLPNFWAFFLIFRIKKSFLGVYHPNVKTLTIQRGRSERAWRGLLPPQMLVPEYNTRLVEGWRHLYFFIV